MTTVRRLLVAVLLCTLILAPRQAGATAPQTIVVTDDHGTTVTLAAPARRIIALAPNVTEILFALGLGSRVVAVSSYSTYPAAARTLPVVINYTSLDTERILALKPDLLIAAAIVPQSALTTLSRLHLTVLMTDPHDLPGILTDLRLVGHATGTEAAAATLVTRLQRRIAAVATRVRRAHSHPSVFYELDPAALYTVGHGSFIDNLITRAGGINIAGTFNNPYPQISRETLLKDNPDLFILGDTDAGATVAGVARRPGFAVLRAVKEHHVYPFNADLISRPGPRIVDGLEALARIIHPELFR